ncbi:MAG: NADH-quinone oxidoreductase subunit G [Candidatus Nanopelagicaceae bacterium]
MTPEQALLETQAPVEMITVVIDGFEVTVPKGTLVIRAAEKLGIQIPRFCDHPLLDPAGACRQCLVDIEINGRAFPKPQASCTIPVENNMIVKTQLTSPVAEKAQAGIMEFLLINHPLDCPVCDKGGECPLQNQAMSNGRPESRYEGVKRTFEKPVPISSQVLLDRERCVLCARCTRFSEQIAGDPFITLNERGALQQVGIYANDPFESYYSGNTVQICPVGALTGASYRFRARPFDLVSVDSACEHCASGCAMRTDIRRGKTLRRLAGDDASVNEEWNCDKGRWAFKYLTSRERVTTPMIRGADGELHEASWPEAIAFAAAGLKNKRAGVLVGGRATVEDAYGYSKFARVALGTNDIDFRSRPHSDEETSFLSSIALDLTTTYKDIDKADQVVLLGFEPEEESPIVFLRLYKQVRKRALVVLSNAPFASRGSTKLKAKIVSDISTIAGLTSKSVILVGERLAETSGAISAAVALAEKSGAKLAWIPRRAGERGALAAGAISTLLPGSRPVSDASARVDVAAAWSVDSLPSNPGRSTSEILLALSVKNLDAVVIGGVDPLDISNAALTQLLNSFVVSLEITHSAITAIADVVLPVAAVVEKSGSFQDWQGSPRAFDKAIADSLSRSDVRILSMLADEMGSPINLPTVAATAREITALGKWDGKADAFESVAIEKESAAGDKLNLSSWRLLLDLGTLQDGEANLAGTARKASAHISSARAEKLGVKAGDLISISSDFGSLKLPVEISEMADNAIWVPRNSIGSQVIANLGFTNGEVTVVKA